MASFAQLDANSVVLRVVAVDNKNLLDDAAIEQEYIGVAFLNRILGGDWKQTSYNTNGGVHLLGGTPFRKNFAGIGYTYDAARDAFIPPKPSDDATLDETTCQWIVPAIALSLGADSSESGDSI